MSYEYSIRLDSSSFSASSVIDALRSSHFIAYEKENCIALKDPNSRNSWSHDLRVFLVSERELLLEITNSTNELYTLVRSALPQKYSLTEVEDEDELSLEQVFSLR
jgi:hypothetical protein